MEIAESGSFSVQLSLRLFRLLAFVQVPEEVYQDVCVSIARSSSRSGVSASVL
jgi:hypothetical protein